MFAVRSSWVAYAAVINYGMRLMCHGGYVIDFRRGVYEHKEIG
jgi:hypothetical protein